MDLKDFTIMSEAARETVEKATADIAKLKDELEKSLQKMKEHQEFIQVYGEEDVVTFCVGGSKFSTKMSNLKKFPESVLCKLAEGSIARNVLSDGSIFIDRDPQGFFQVLRYLRSESYFLEEELGTLYNLRCTVSLIDLCRHFSATDITVSLSDTGNGTVQNLLNENNTDEVESEYGSSGSKWIRYIFKEPVKVHTYTIKTCSYDVVLKSWRLEVLMDHTWKVIDEIVDDDKFEVNNCITRVFTVSSVPKESNRFYRLVITKSIPTNMSHSTPQSGDFELLHLGMSGEV
jgi:hypothetical protein